MIESKLHTQKRVNYAFAAVVTLLILYFLPFNKIIPDFNAFLTIFISIILEAVPFLLMGTLISSLINTFVTPDFINKHLPKNRFLAIIGASLFGLIFPVCECAIIPIARRLIKKGLPLHVAITFLFSVPIINPVVILSTFYAFNGDIKILLSRIILGFAISVLIGLRISLFKKEDRDVLKTMETDKIPSHGHEHCGHEEGVCSAHEEAENSQKPFIQKTLDVINHARMEFFDVVGFFVLGALISSVFNTYLPRSVLNDIGTNPLISIIIMMAFAYVLSICSESDAFIARTFSGSFSSGSLVSFMVFGPMLDIKNTLMLIHYFKPGFVIWVAAYLVVLNLIFAFIANILL